MISGIMWILMGWFIPMPIWLGILMNVFGAIKIFAFFKEIDITRI